MPSKKILIAGIGGVGGYFGGLLAREYNSNSEVEIYFLARGENLIQIKKEGIVIKEKDSQFVAQPNKVSDDVADFGKVDVILLCTKTYDLEEVIAQLMPVITDETIFIPLQNGVNSRERISEILPNNLVTDGCAYIVSMLEKQGVVVKKSDSHKLSFGIKGALSTQLNEIHELFLKADINSKLSPEIETIVWEKYIFISSIAGATTYYDSDIGTVLSDKNKKETLIKLIEEVTQLAAVKKIKMEKELKESILKNLATLPFNSITSMHRDFRANNDNNELESLVGYVVKESKRLGLKLESFTLIYNLLNSNPINNIH